MTCLAAGHFCLISVFVGNDQQTVAPGVVLLQELHVVFVPDGFHMAVPGVEVFLAGAGDTLDGFAVDELIDCGPVQVAVQAVLFPLQEPAAAAIPPW